MEISWNLQQIEGVESIKWSHRIHAIKVNESQTQKESPVCSIVGVAAVAIGHFVLGTLAALAPALDGLVLATALVNETRSASVGYFMSHPQIFQWLLCPIKSFGLELQHNLFQLHIQRSIISQDNMSICWHMMSELSSGHCNGRGTSARWWVSLLLSVREL